MDELPVPASEHVVALKLPGAAPLLQVIVPVGVTVVPELVSLTVAVQVVGEFTTSGLGPQLTVVVVLRRLSVIDALPLLLL